MAPARPSSPTSLLWAHQLKREHNLLLQHIQKIESALQEQSSRLGQLERVSAAIRNETIFTSLSERIAALEENGNNGRLDAVENQAKSDIQSLQTQQTGIQRQIDTLHSEHEEATSERQRVLDQGQLLLQRVEDLEAGLKVYERSLVQLGEELNKAQIQSIRTQMAMLVQLVEKSDTQLDTLQQSVAALETSHVVLMRENEGLDAKIRSLGVRIDDHGGGGGGEEGGYGGGGEVIPESEEVMRETTNEPAQQPHRPKRTAAIYAALALDSQTTTKSKRNKAETTKKSAATSHTRAPNGRFVKAINKKHDSPGRLWKSRGHFLADVESGIAAKEQGKDQASNFMQADFELPAIASKQPRASVSKGKKCLSKSKMSETMKKSAVRKPALRSAQDVQSDTTIPPRRTIPQPSQSFPEQNQLEHTPEMGTVAPPKPTKPTTNKANILKSAAMVTRAAADRQSKQYEELPAEPDILASPLSSSPPEPVQQALTTGQVQPETPKTRVAVEPVLPETPHPRMASLRRRPVVETGRRQILQYDSSSSL